MPIDITGASARAPQRAPHRFANPRSSRHGGVTFALASDTVCAHELVGRRGRAALAEAGLWAGIKRLCSGPVARHLAGGPMPVVRG
ncbi:hypothetical protein [Chitinasiproducens palmae]|uniref:hypothetical protein n=1 Tax=Chitinasiproducens palmae TaxID=1770053 RepID=UPI000B89EA07|nr:hypothetical protein [Chitinasiproducens palmae]